MEAEKERAYVAFSAAEMAKWFRVLFWLMILNLAGSIINNFLADLLPFLYIPGVCLQRGMTGLETGAADTHPLETAGEEVFGDAFKLSAAETADGTFILGHDEQHHTVHNSAYKLQAHTGNI